MPVIAAMLSKTKETLDVYWILVRIMVPVALATEALSRLGVIEALAPAFGPVMNLVGLPPELGLAWLTGLLVGMWGAVPIIFTLVPVAELTTADITVFSGLLLIAHALPVEQKIIQKAGPGMILTSLLRVAGGLVYAFILHHVLALTGWLSEPVKPAWIPMNSAEGWSDVLLGLLDTMFWMFVILLSLSWALAFLRWLGLLDLMVSLMAPLLHLAGVKREAGHLAAVGLFLGISYGGGLLIREARSGAVSPRQVFITCVFMGFAHSIIEDTLLVMALGADPMGVLFGRLAFAVAVTALIAYVTRVVSDVKFFRWAFRAQGS